MAQPPLFDSVLSFGRAADLDADRPANDGAEAVASDAGSSDDDDDAGFEFAFAPPLKAAGHEAEDVLAPADDLFAHGRILPAYPVFDRHIRDHDEATAPQPQASTAPPSPDTYCAWTPGSPAREGPFPKSASTGEAHRWRLRDLVGVGARSHSDGKEKFVFLQAPAAATPSKMSGNATVSAETTEGKQSTKPSAQQQQKQSKNKSKATVTEMDMATAHRLFYGKQDAAAGDRKQRSYLPYRPGIFGFFATAHAFGRSHHPY